MIEHKPACAHQCAINIDDVATTATMTTKPSPVEANDSRKGQAKGS